MRPSRPAILWGVVAVVFIALVIAGVIVSSPTAWFLFALVAFTLLVIGLAPWILGN